MMGIIMEESRYDEFPLSLEVVERSDGECRDPWKIIALEIDPMPENLTPVDLRRLGAWLVREGRRIGREYTSKGSKRIKK